MNEAAGSSRTPSDLNAEKAVLGGIIGDNQVFDEVSKLLDAGDFHLPGHAAIYEAMIALQKATPPVPIDQLTLTAELRKLGKLNQVGGMTYLAELEGFVPTTVNTRSYAQIVQEKSVKRRMIESCRELMEMSAEPGTDVKTLLDEAQRRMFGLAERTRDTDLRPFNQVMDKTLELIEKLRASGGGGVTGLPSGYGDLDRMLTGFHEGELIIIAARPGCGKTSFVLNAAAHAALHAQRPVAIFSLEMPEDQLAVRLLSAESRIDMKRIREGRLGAAQMEQLSHTAARLYNAPIFIDDSGSLSSFDLRTKARRLQTTLSQLDKPQSLG
ncbi:MAG: replicative DNA helicase, partial [Myxococcales bacterium]